MNETEHIHLLDEDLDDAFAIWIDYLPQMEVVVSLSNQPTGDGEFNWIASAGYAPDSVAAMRWALDEHARYVIFRDSAIAKEKIRSTV